MSKQNNSSSSSGIGFVGLLTIVFITLKLLGKIAWSWWWVLSPIWISIIAIVVIIVLVVSIASFFDSRSWIEFKRKVKRFKLKHKHLFCKHEFEPSMFQALNGNGRSYKCKKCGKVEDK